MVEHGKAKQHHLSMQNRKLLDLTGVSNVEEWIKTLLMYAIPVCLGSLAVPLMNLVDTFTVPRLLRGEGLDELQSMVSFGIYNRGLPLVQLVTMLATSLSVLCADESIRQNLRY